MTIIPIPFLASPAEGTDAESLTDELTGAGLGAGAGEWFGE